MSENKKNKAKVFVKDNKNFYGYNQLPVCNEVNPELAGKIPNNKDVDPLKKDLRSTRAITIALESLKEN